MNSNTMAFVGLEHLLMGSHSRAAHGNDYAGYFWPMLSDFLAYVKK